MADRVSINETDQREEATVLSSARARAQVGEYSLAAMVRPKVRSLVLVGGTDNWDGKAVESGVLQARRQPRGMGESTYTAKFVGQVT